MSSLMALSSRFGVKTLGFDMHDGEYLNELRQGGGNVAVGATELPPDAKLIVYTLAVSDNDPILVQAEKRKIPSVSRAEYMSAVSIAYRTKIAVSGSHGKSTVTSMLHHILTYACLNPTTLSGARLGCGNSAYHIGSLDCFIYEACEYCVSE